VMEYDFAARINEHCGVEHGFAGPLDQAGANVNLVPPRGIAQGCARGSIRDFIRFGLRERMGPAERHGLRQNHHLRAVDGGFLDTFESASKIFFFAPALDEHLGQGQFEGSPLHRAQ